MLYSLLLFVHIIVSILLVVSVLMQSSKGGGLAGTFGGSGMSGGVFGGRGAAPFLVKATTTCAILFMITSISLNLVGSSTKSESALERVRMESSGVGSEPAVTTEMPLSTESQSSEPITGGGTTDDAAGQSEEK